jgi:hypothetical protein
MSTNEFLILGGIGIGSMIVAVAWAHHIVAVALLDARDRITTLIRQRDEAQASALRYALEVSRLLDLLDTITRERDEARSLCDETINLFHDADREADTLRTQLAAARFSMQAMELSRDKRLERARATEDV